MDMRGLFIMSLAIWVCCYNVKEAKTRGMGSSESSQSGAIHYKTGELQDAYGCVHLQGL